MRFSRLVRASDSQCCSRNCPSVVNRLYVYISVDED